MINKCSQKMKFFSLIELMVSIAIVGILLTLSAPVMKKMFTVQGTKAAAITVKITLERARSMAINNNKPVAVVFLQNEIDNERGKELAYRALRICQVERDSVNYKFKKWLDNWSELDEGNILVAVREISTVKPFETDNTDFSDAMHNEAVSSVFNFTPQKVDFTDATSIKPFKDISPKTPAKLPNNSSKTLTGLVFTPNGRTDNSLVFFIAKGNYVPGNSNLINKDKQANTYGEFVYTNKFTGRTKYGEIQE